MIKKFIYNLENYKIHQVIGLLIFLFFVIMLFNFYLVQKELKTLSVKNRIAISKDIDYSILSWIENRINNLESNEKHLPKEALLGNEKILKDYLDIFLNNKLYFDTVQAYIYDVFFYVNSTMIFDFRHKLPLSEEINNKEVFDRPWFFNTKKNMKTTMTVMNYHGVLLQETINICTPIKRKNEFKGILCGVIKIDDILQKLKNMHFPDNAYFFIIDKNSKILTKIDNENKYLLQKAFKNKSINISCHKPEQIEINNDFITIRKLKHFDWYIGVGVKQSTINKKALERFTANSFLLFILLIIIILIINSAHIFIQRKVEKKKDEYGYILAHRSKMCEIGELISGINHQLCQPINSLSLLLSNTLLLQKQKKLDKNILSENLIMCKEATKLMSNTIKMFRNFYRCNESVTKFSLEEAINGVLHVMHIDLIKNNIIIEVDYLSQKNTVISVENFLQQILLVLIQNAKEALQISDNFDKRILINVDVKDDYTYIDVIDKADGVALEVIITLFKNLKASKKKLGSGIGLYFAKKLAEEKLLGDLILHSSSSPTIFRLSFLNELKTKE